MWRGLAGQRAERGAERAGRAKGAPAMSDPRLTPRRPHRAEAVAARHASTTKVNLAIAKDAVGR